MLKGLSLAKKIAGGFSIILCLLILLAFVGRTGITRVVDRVDAANHFQSLMNLILDARQNEKQFILTNEADGVSQVKKDISKLKEKIGEITRLSMDDDLAKGIKDISTGLGAYEKSFGEYVDMAHQKDILVLLQKRFPGQRDRSGVKFTQHKKTDFRRILSALKFLPS
ncbi:MAG: hypothetical protein HUN05_14835 [Desulfobacter sp.]|nr:MAG: hypothetical protein HUN05_14835 [Desulfobacter sp.]